MSEYSHKLILSVEHLQEPTGWSYSHPLQSPAAQHNITSKTDKVCQTDNIVAANKGKTGLNALHKLNKHRLAIYRTSRTTFAVLRFTHKSIILNFILNYFYSLLNLDLNSKAFMQGLPSSVYTWRTLDTATEFRKIHRSSLKWTNIL